MPITNKIRKNDFIEIRFTGKVKGTSEVFDSNIKEELEKINPNPNENQLKPFIFCLGQKMFLKAIDNFLIGKDTGKEYEIELEPEKAFGKRDPKLIKIIPMRIFREQKINPMPGMAFNFDGQIVRILSVSGGRIITDFNNPLAGKTLVYNIRVLRKVPDTNEKIKALMDFFFRKEFKFTINKKHKKLIIEADKEIAPFLNSQVLKDKFKEMLGLELGVREEKTDKKE